MEGVLVALDLLAGFFPDGDGRHGADDAVVWHQSRRVGDEVDRGHTGSGSLCGTAGLAEGLRSSSRNSLVYTAVVQRSRAPILFGLLVLITVVPALIKFYTDWIWFVQVGYLEVFLRSITARLALGSIAFVLAFGVLAANFNLAKGSLRRREFRIMGEDGPRIVSVDLTRMKAFVYLGAGVLAFLIALYAAAANPSLG